MGISQAPEGTGIVGNLVLEGDSQELLTNPEVKKAYLGG